MNSPQWLSSSSRYSLYMRHDPNIQKRVDVLASNIVDLPVCYGTLPVVIDHCELFYGKRDSVRYASITTKETSEIHIHLMVQTSQPCLCVAGRTRTSSEQLQQSDIWLEQ